MKKINKESLKVALKAALFVLYDIAAFSFAWIASMFVSKYSVHAVFWETIWYFIGGVALVVVTNFALKLYLKLWKYASIIEALKVLFSSFIVLLYTIIVNYVSGHPSMRIYWAIITSFIYLVLIAACRFFYRLYTLFAQNNHSFKAADQKRVMIIGAGAAGDELLRDIYRNGTEMLPVCFIDDDVKKVGRSIGDVKVVGTTADIAICAEKYNVQEIIVAIPSAPRREIKRILELCGKTSCKVLSIPGYYQVLKGEVSVSQLKEVEINDLLGREPVVVDTDAIMGYIEGKVVLVTGGGGSIGSELCRQIASHKPKKLIILDIYENNAYDIQQELIRKLPELDLTVLIASVRDKERIESIFLKYKPQIVFHAAAHKHVPLMEVSPNEAVKNNVGGTFNVAECAGKFGVDKFILISTDKAVNPTNVMGATKRICEMIVQMFDKKYETDYVAVRFGNVLGSNGSVIPLFKKQIEDGGPVTVTHKDIVRYFMTIPEAVSLVLEAGAFATGGEIFVLDMGEPVRIYDLALNLIRLSGLEPFKDIDVKVTGLRPGEKLYEERLMDEEGLSKTQNEKISIGKPLVFDSDKFYSEVKSLIEKSYDESADIKSAVSELVPTYKIDRNC